MQPNDRYGERLKVCIVFSDPSETRREARRGVCEALIGGVELAFTRIRSGPSSFLLQREPLSQIVRLFFRFVGLLGQFELHQDGIEPAVVFSADLTQDTRFRKT